MLQCGDCVISLGGRVAAQVQEEVLGERGEARREVELEWVLLDLLQLFVIIFTCLVARVLAARQQLVGDDAASP